MRNVYYFRIYTACVKMKVSIVFAFLLAVCLVSCDPKMGGEGGLSINKRFKKPFVSYATNYSKLHNEEEHVLLHPFSAL